MPEIRLRGIDREVDLVTHHGRFYLCRCHAGTGIRVCRLVNIWTYCMFGKSTTHPLYFITAASPGLQSRHHTRLKTVELDAILFSPRA